MRFQPSVGAVWVILVLLAFPSGADQARTRASSPARTAFVHVNLIPMDRDRLLEDQTVVVEGGRIALIGPSKTIKVRRNDRLIEAKGKYFVPGLVDAHVHLLSPIEFAVYLANGVTTVFNLDGRPAHLLWRKQVASGEVLGPTIFSTGPIFHSKRSAEEDVKLVDEQAAAGYDAIKVYNEVSKEEYPALINEAKSKNLLLMGHVAREPGFAMTLQYGQSIAHLEEIVYTTFNPTNQDDFEHLVLDESKIPEVVRQTKNANIYVTPTLNNFEMIVQQVSDLDTFLKNPELHFLAPWTLVRFQPANNRYKKRLGPEKYPVLRDVLAIQRKLLKALNDQGVPLMAGTDATETGPIAGFGLHHELQEFVQDGLTPYQALLTATVNPARYLRQSSEFGTLEPGKRADMVLLEENPLADISNTQKIAGVVVRGRYLDKKDLSRMLHAVPSEYSRERHNVGAMFRRDPTQATRYLEDHDPAGRLTLVTMSDLASKTTAADLVQMLKTVQQRNPQARLLSEGGINALARALIDQKLYPQAIAVLGINTERFPKSANTWDSLADAFSHLGDVPRAVEGYRKALEADAAYSNADVAKKFIAEHPQQ